MASLIQSLLQRDPVEVEAEVSKPLLQARGEAERIRAFASAGITFESMLSTQEVTSTTGQAIRVTTLDEDRMAAAERFVAMLRSGAK